MAGIALGNRSQAATLIQAAARATTVLRKRLHDLLTRQIMVARGPAVLLTARLGIVSRPMAAATAPRHTALLARHTAPLVIARPAMAGRDPMRRVHPRALAAEARSTSAHPQVEGRHTAEAAPSAAAATAVVAEVMQALEVEAAATIVKQKL